eukprot:m.124959 g.124959  ORF g.124959 m.124959 type:complete len:68 (+) comp37862_c1_seq10:1621-1824(+)
MLDKLMSFLYLLLFCSFLCTGQNASKRTSLCLDGPKSFTFLHHLEIQPVFPLPTPFQCVQWNWVWYC